jgi:predicted transcriptional regulator YdeE
MKCNYELYDERCIGEKGNVCEIYIPVAKRET